MLVDDVDKSCSDENNLNCSPNATLLEDVATHTLISHSYKKELLAAVVLWTGLVAAGMVSGYTSPTLDDLLAEGHLQSTDQASWFASISTLGGTIGNTLAGFLFEKMGRKFAVMCAGVPFTLGWLCIALDGNFALLCVGRVLTGMGCGLCILSAFVYLAEISSPAIRGILAAFGQFFATVGILASSSLGLVLTWRWLAVASSVVATVFVLGTLLLPESPRWLCEHRSHEEVLASLQWLRGRDYPVEEEYTFIKAAVDCDRAQGSVSAREFLRERHLRSPLLICMALVVFQQLCGINVFLFYAKPIFESAGFGSGNDSAGSSSSSSVAAIILAGVQLAGCLVACGIVDRIGRRILLIISAIFMALSTASMGVFFYLTLEVKINTDIGWLSLFSLLVYMIAFNLGMGPLPMLILGELLPGRAKGKAGILISFCYQLSGFAIILSFQPMEQAFHPYGAFWFFTGICALLTIFVAVFLPETKGRRLEDIEKLFT